MRQETKINFHSLFFLLEIFSKLLCSFRTWTILTLPLHCRIKGLLNGKVPPRCGRKRAPSDSITYSLSLLRVFLFLHYLYVFAFIFWVSLVLCIAFFNMFLFGHFSVLLYFVFHKNFKKNFEKSEKYKNSVCFCTLVLVYLGWPLKQSFLNFVSFVT